MYRAKKEDKTKLYRYWVENDNERNQDFYDAFFHYKFDAKNHMYFAVDNEIQTALCSRNKVLSLHGNLLKTNLIMGPVYTEVEFAKEMLENILYKSSQENLITFAYPNEAFDFHSFGFEPVIETYTYNISVDSIPKLGVSGIILQPDFKDLTSVYNSFTDHFTSYFVRDEKEFDTLTKIYKSLGGGVIAYAEDQKVKGYAFYIRHQNYIEVKECCYDTSGTLVRMLSFLSKGVTRILLTVSESERIQKLFPNAKRRVNPFLLARINDHDLFERLYHIKIISAYSGIHAFGKPVFNRDFIG